MGHIVSTLIEDVLQFAESVTHDLFGTAKHTPQGTAVQAAGPHQRFVPRQNPGSGVGVKPPHQESRVVLTHVKAALNARVKRDFELDDDSDSLKVVVHSTDTGRIAKPASGGLKMVAYNPARQIGQYIWKKHRNYKFILTDMVRDQNKDLVFPPRTPDGSYPWTPNGTVRGQDPHGIPLTGSWGVKLTDFERQVLDHTEENCLDTQCTGSSSTIFEGVPDHVFSKSLLSKRDSNAIVDAYHDYEYGFENRTDLAQEWFSWAMQKVSDDHNDAAEGLPPGTTKTWRVEQTKNMLMTLHKRSLEQPEPTPEPWTHPIGALMNAWATLSAGKVNADTANLTNHLVLN